MNTIAIYQTVVLALAIAAWSVTTSRARVFAGVRSWIADRNSWLGELVACPYCTCHWLALGLTLAYRPRLVQLWLPLDLLVTVFVMVATASMVAGVIMLLIPFHGDDDQNDIEEEVEQLREALETARTALRQKAKQIRELSGDSQD